MYSHQETALWRVEEALASILVEQRKTRLAERGWSLGGSDLPTIAATAHLHAEVVEMALHRLCALGHAVRQEWREVAYWLLSKQRQRELAARATTQEAGDA